MSAIQEFSKMLEVEASDNERSILLVDIMNAMGFSKSEREIHRHGVHLLNVLVNIIPSTDKSTTKIAGSNSEGMCGGIFGHRSHHDSDCLITGRQIKLCTPRTNNINNTPLLHNNEDYDACCFVEEDENFPGYVKLLLADVNADGVNMSNCSRMHDDKLYLSSSMMMDLVNKQLVTSSNDYIPYKFSRLLYSCENISINGPAHTIHNKDNEGFTKSMDIVYCIHCDFWPTSANSLITRRKPNNWPSNRMLEHIQSQGYDVATVGHHDSQNNDIQWRISFPGEHSLFLDLTDVQLLCYALIKIILKENLNTSQREVVSSFHIKHVMFWCVELWSFQWEHSNYINCVNLCLTELIQMIKVRHIPHYILKSRNLFNSKLTEKMSKEIVDVLSKYDTTHVFTLDAFTFVFKITKYNTLLLKQAAFTSTILSCFDACFNTFFTSWFQPSTFWYSYMPHNATKSLLNYGNILKKIKKLKGVPIHYVKYLVRSMIGFLYYVKYKETKKAAFLLVSKRLIGKSLNLDNSCVKLRAATFFLTNMEYWQSIEICDTFLTFPPRHKIGSSSLEYITDIWVKVFEQLVEGKTTETIEKIMMTILSVFHSSVKLKSVPGNYDIIQDNPVWILGNFTNIFFHGLYIDVTFMTAEQWVVPGPILYELLSLRNVADNEETPFAGIHLDPMFACLQTKFLCYHSMGNVNGMPKMLTLMNSFITKTTFITQSSCAYLNMLAYCLIKSGDHRQSVKYILQSLRIFPSKYNTASGYLKIVIQILNSLFIWNC